MPVVVAGAGLVLVLVLVVVPVTCSSGMLELARAAPLPDAFEGYQAAAALDPLDPVPLAEFAERFARQPVPGRMGDALAALDKAIQRDPERISLYRLRSRLYELRYSASGDGFDLLKAIDATQKAVSLYPASPDEHLAWAEVMARAARAGGRAFVAEARREYQKALDLDAARPGTDEVRKWSERQRREIQERLAALNAVPSTQPATRSSP